ncbi:hypothetical protein L211DRAFT_869132 [Terfezia boudieri ATCC MYA-4762]|uniref:Uncharacterized protein n=1 Tax=Terfezia boudieri ATCC MYA-4762 TaxID=1051890 RepID=A0A3N4LIC0_9PEZI|nr:hypothetical protein L211DRAFT_869132 [Terfezia boudieri ATCC MYA-4762]
MSTSFTAPIRTPDTFGRHIWGPCSTTSSSGSSGSDSDASSDISGYSKRPSTPDGSQYSRRTQDMVDMAEGIIKQTSMESEAVVLAVGSKERIKEYVTKTRRNTKAATRFRSATIREIATLIYTYIGYESIPSTLEPAFDDYNLTSYFITRKDYTHFIHGEVSLVARALQLANTRDTHTLLKFVSPAFLSPLNVTVHTVTLSDALEAISWLETTSLTKVSTTLGWTTATAQDIRVFITAARKLLPPWSLQPGFTLTKANSEVSLKKFVLFAREQNFTLMAKARAWGFQALAAKRKKFFDKANKEGLIPSLQDLNAKASKEEFEQLKEDTNAKASKEEFEQLKEDTNAKASKEETKAEFEQLKKGNEAKLDGLKEIISLVLKGHPLAEEIGTRLQNL